MGQAKMTKSEVPIAPVSPLPLSSLRPTAFQCSTHTPWTIGDTKTTPRQMWPRRERFFFQGNARCHRKRTRIRPGGLDNGWLPPCHKEANLTATREEEYLKISQRVSQCRLRRPGTAQTRPCLSRGVLVVLVPARLPGHLHLTRRLTNNTINRTVRDHAKSARQTRDISSA